MTKGMIGAIRGLGEKSRYLRFVYEWTTKSLEAIGKTDKGDKDYKAFSTLMNDLAQEINLCYDIIDDLSDMLKHAGEEIETEPLEKEENEE